MTPEQAITLDTATKIIVASIESGQQSIAQLDNFGFQEVRQAVEIARALVSIVQQED